MKYMTVMKMKQIIGSVLCAGMLFLAQIPLFNTAGAQTIKIPGTASSLALTEGSWSYLRTFQLDDGADVYVYYYSKTTILSRDGDTVLPCLRIYVNKKYTGDLTGLVFQRYMAQPYQSLQEYQRGPGLPKSGGFGYLGAYTNPTEGKDYGLLMTYFKSGTAFVELRLETTADTFEMMREEFNKVLSTVK